MAFTVLGYIYRDVLYVKPELTRQIVVLLDIDEKMCTNFNFVKFFFFFICKRDCYQIKKQTLCWFALFCAIGQGKPNSSDCHKLYPTKGKENVFCCRAGVDWPLQMQTESRGNLPNQLSLEVKVGLKKKKKSPNHLHLRWDILLPPPPMQSEVYHSGRFSCLTPSKAIMPLRHK